MVVICTGKAVGQRESGCPTTDSTRNPHLHLRRQAQNAVGPLLDRVRPVVNARCQLRADHVLELGLAGFGHLPAQAQAALDHQGAEHACVVMRGC